MNRHANWAVGLGVVAASLAVPLTAQPALAKPAKTPAVDLEDFTTETTKVKKLSDGTLELTAHREPVRVKRSGSWLDIDTEVTPTSTGRLAPEAAIGNVTFSGGGSGPLATMGTGDEKFSLAWEGTLPKPVVNGDAVTYPDVRPGTDLVLTATSTGFTQVLVIKDEQAARGIIETPVALAATSKKLRFKPRKDGSTQVVDSDGDVVHEGASAVMWDSRGSDEPTAQDPAEGAISKVVTNVETDGSSMTTTLAPPAAAVEDPKTEYPLFLDPTYEQNDNYYRTVHKAGWNYSEAGQPMRVGNCGWAECNDSTQLIARSFFQFNVMALRNGIAPSPAKIFDATLSVKQTHNASSAAQPVKLHRTPSIPLSWPGTLGTHIQTISSSAGYGSTASATLNFSNDNVTSYLQSYANANNDDLLIRFALAAQDESDRNQWKKFDNNPKLTVKYAYAPTVPVLGIEPSHNCFGLVSTGSAPRLRATSLAIGNTGELNYEFQLDNLGTTTNPDHTATRTKASNSAAEWATSGLANGKWRFRARAIQYVAGSSGNNQPSGWSAWSEFTVDTVRPGTAEVYSPTHPEDHWGAATNAQAVFKLGGDSDTTEFNWAINNEPATVPNNNCFANVGGSTARQGTVGAGTDLVLTGLSQGTHQLKVRAVDAARNVSTSVTTYTFMVAPSRTKPDGAPADGLNRIEFETMQGTSLDPAKATVTTNSLMTASGSGSVVNTPSASPSDPAAARYRFTPKVDATHSLGVRYVTNVFGGKFRIAVTDPGANATSTADDVVHRFYDDRDGDGTATEVTVNSAASAPTVYSSIRHANFTDYLSGDGLKLKAGRQYLLDVELVTGGGGISQLAILDALVLAPINESPFNSLRDTFNNQALNHGTAVHGFELQQSGTKAISAASLANQGFVSGSSTPFTVGGSSFTIPASKSMPASHFDRPVAAADNTVANGQTIALPAGTKGRYVDLLVTSTCGPVTPHPSRAMTLMATIEGANSNRDFELSGVPHWLDQSPSGVHASVQVTPVGAASNQPNAHLYVLRFDLQSKGIYPTDVLTSLTLPNLGTVAGTPCGQVGSQALHVFAMSVVP